MGFPFVSRRGPVPAGPTCLLTFVVAIVLAGCGGGGGGNGGGSNPPSTLRLQGEYAYVVLVRDPTANEVRTETGLANANGQGSFDVTSYYIVNEGGTFGPLTQTPATYTEGTDRAIALTGLAGVSLEGRVADDGSLALLSSRGPQNPAMAIVMRRAVSPPISDLAGVWTELSWGRVTAPNRAESAIADATITATGALTVNGATYVYNLDGQINPLPVGFLPEQLTVQPDGWLTRSVPPSAPDFRGAVSVDRNLILLGGNLGGAKLAAIHVLVRQGLAATTGALAGEYYESNFESTLLGYLDGFGPMTLDGGGTGTWQYAVNLEGASAGPGPINVTYGVAPNGAVGLQDTGSGVTWNGQVGPGGDWAFLTGGYTTNSNPLILVLLR